MRGTGIKRWMIPTIIGLILGATYLVLTQGLPRLTINQSTNPTTGFADDLARVLPFTVSILSNQGVPREGLTDDIDPYFEKFITSEPSQQSSLGSGIIISESGAVVTNAHVINNAENIIVVLPDGTQVSVTDVRIDPATDIALLQTTLQINQPPPIGNSSTLRIGDLVFTVGNPFGVGQSVSMGIVSATGRQQPGLTTLTDFIQTDAAINPGNSGGALVDQKGNVVGMNAAIFSSTGGNQGIGFAIPIEQVLTIAAELQSRGSVARGYLGIDVTEVLSDDSFSIQIVSVQAGSPAAENGIQTGDVLTQINGTAVLNRTQAARLIAQFKPFDTVQLTIQRDETIITVDTLLSERP